MSKVCLSEKYPSPESSAQVPRMHLTNQLSPSKHVKSYLHKSSSLNATEQYIYFRLTSKPFTGRLKNKAPCSDERKESRVGNGRRKVKHEVQFSPIKRPAKEGSEIGKQTLSMFKIPVGCIAQRTVFSHTYASRET